MIEFVNNQTVEIDTKGIDGLIASLGKVPSIKVGILGDKNAREGASNSNATVGAVHEFGTTTHPMRSFLRMPLTEKLQSYLEKAGAFDKASDTMKTVMKEKSFMSWAKKVAIVAERIVADAFDTGGFGKWKPSNMEHKQTKQTLVETQQLRNAITSEVKE